MQLRCDAQRCLIDRRASLMRRPPLACRAVRGMRCNVRISEATGKMKQDEHSRRLGMRCNAVVQTDATLDTALADAPHEVSHGVCFSCCCALRSSRSPHSRQRVQQGRGAGGGQAVRGEGWCHAGAGQAERLGVSVTMYSGPHSAKRRPAVYGQKGERRDSAGSSSLSSAQPIRFRPLFLR